MYEFHYKHRLCLINYKNKQTNKLPKNYLHFFKKKQTLNTQTDFSATSLHNLLMQQWQYYFHRRKLILACYPVTKLFLHLILFKMKAFNTSKLIRIAKNIVHFVFKQQQLNTFFWNDRENNTWNGIFQYYCMRVFFSSIINCSWRILNHTTCYPQCC